MCVVVDACALPALFDPDNADHIELQPILEWLLDKRGKMVYGGSKYLSEKNRIKRFSGIMGEFERQGIIRVPLASDNSKIDKREQRIIGTFPKKAFNDYHLPAIISVIKCRILCSKNTTHYTYVRRSVLYPKKMKIPYVYRDSKDAWVLNQHDVLKHCGPCKS